MVRRCRVLVIGANWRGKGGSELSLLYSSAHRQGSSSSSDKAVKRERAARAITANDHPNPAAYTPNLCAFGVHFDKRKRGALDQCRRRANEHRDSDQFLGSDALSSLPSLAVSPICDSERGRSTAVSQVQYIDD